MVRVLSRNTVRVGRPIHQNGQQVCIAGLKGNPAITNPPSRGIHIGSKLIPQHLTLGGFIRIGGSIGEIRIGLIVETGTDSLGRG